MKTAPLLKGGACARLIPNAREYTKDRRQGSNLGRAAPAATKGRLRAYSLSPPPSGPFSARSPTGSEQPLAHLGCVTAVPTPAVVCWEPESSTGVDAFGVDLRSVLSNLTPCSAAVFVPRDSYVLAHTLWTGNRGSLRLGATPNLAWLVTNSKRRCFERLGTAEIYLLVTASATTTVCTAAHPAKGGRKQRGLPAPMLLLSPAYSARSRVLLGPAQSQQRGVKPAHAKGRSTAIPSLLGHDSQVLSVAR